MTNSSNVFENKDRVIFYDGMCSVCNFWIQQVLDSPNARSFYFAQLQSEKAEKFLKSQSHIKDLPDAIAYYRDGEVFFKSAASLRVAKDMGGYLGIVGTLAAAIGAYRFYDIIYDWIARNRYDWFGENKQCRLLTPEEREQFLVSSS